MTAATLVKENTTPTPVKEDSLVTVALRRDAIAHLKWLNEKYIHSSLEDALDEIIAVAANAYRQKKKLGLIVKPISTSATSQDEKLVVISLHQKTIAHLKWVHQKYIKKNTSDLYSLDDSLDVIISVAAFIYKQRETGVLSIKTDGYSWFYNPFTKNGKLTRA